MRFIEFLIEKETVIVAGWVDLVMATYPPETVKIFKGGQDRFANPLGHTLKQGIVDLFKTLVAAQVEQSAIDAALEGILLVRALEKVAPSEALSFVFGLKKAVKDAMGKEQIDDLAEAWPVFASKVDELALNGFDIYTACRERLYNTRINELKSGRHILTDGGNCPSALMRKNKEQSKDLKTMNNLCSQEAR